MTTEPGYDPETDPDTGQPEPKPRWREDLERRAADGDKAREEAKTARERADKAERELLFHKLGINPAEGIGALFADAYKGDLTEDAMRSAASRYGVLPRTSATPEQVTAAQQVAAVSEDSEHTTTATDWESQLAALPQYGHPGWEQGEEKALALLEQHGGTVTRQKPKGQVTLFDASGRRIKPDQAAGMRR